MSLRVKTFLILLLSMLGWGTCNLAFVPYSHSQDRYKRLGDPVVSVPLKGGAVTSREPHLLAMGQLSMAQNVRGKHPGYVKRLGQRALHTTADSTNRVLSLYQFNKSRISESHWFAQMSDADVLSGTNSPPTVTTGVFGSEVFSGTNDSNHKPASWSNIKDLLLYSNGSDQHQIYAGTSNYVSAAILYTGDSSGTKLPYIPTEGKDYSVEAADGSTGTSVILNSMSGVSCLFLCTPVPVTGFYFGISNPNSNAVTTGVSYFNGAWAAVSSLVDNTATGVSAFNVSNTVTFSAQSDVIPKYQFGRSGYWYQIGFSGSLDSATGVTEIKYSAPFQSITNVWDGVPVAAVEVYLEAGVSRYYTYSSDSVALENLSGTSRVYVASADPIEAIYIDPGGTPNTTGTSLVAVRYWNGSKWTTLNRLLDATSGVSNPGWVTFERQADVQPRSLFSSQHHSYWYELQYNSKGFASDTVASFDVMPYFKITDFGARGNVNCVWKNRALYTFDSNPDDIYVSKSGSPMTLNGSDFAILEPGDGRSNKVVAMAKFHNELLVWQEEVGVEGGSLTLFEGYSPTTFGMLVLSPKIGTLNSRTAVVVDGVILGGANPSPATVAFFLSRYGVFITDGRTVSLISQDVQNYFDPNEPECIRRGYEDRMWVAYDSTYNVVRVGLVSGSSATECNVFLVYDIVDKCWYFDSLGQPLACAAEVRAESGVTSVIQVGGGTNTGTVYQLNYGYNDISTPIDSYIQPEFDFHGLELVIREILLRVKAASGNSVVVTPILNGNEQSGITVAQTARNSGESSRKNRFSPGNLPVFDHVGLRVQNRSTDQSMYLENLGVDIRYHELD